MENLLGFGAVSGLAGMAGQMINNQSNAISAQNAFNLEMGASNTAHQREVEDLKAAGLNPILSAGGSGAGTPSAPMAPQGNVIGSGISAAKDAMQTKMQLEQNDNDTKVKNANVVKTLADAAMTSAQTSKENAYKKIWDVINKPLDDIKTKVIEPGWGPFKKNILPMIQPLTHITVPPMK